MSEKKEHIVGFTRKHIDALEEGFNSFQKYPDLFQGMVEDLVLMGRDEFEANQNFRHPATYIPIYTRDEEGKVKFFTYRRLKTVGEQKLVGNASIGIGGHVPSSLAARALVNPHESELFNALSVGSLRELDEEITINGLKFSEYCGLGFKFGLGYNGLIMDNSNEVGRQHFGFVGLLELPNTVEVKISEESQETVGFLYPEEIFALESVENWTKILVEYLGTEEGLDSFKTIGEGFESSGVETYNSYEADNALSMIIGDNWWRLTGINDWFENTAGVEIWENGIKPTELLRIYTLYRENEDDLGKFQELLKEVLTELYPASADQPGVTTPTEDAIQKLMKANYTDRRDSLVFLETSLKPDFEDRAGAGALASALLHLADHRRIPIMLRDEVVYSTKLLSSLVSDYREGLLSEVRTNLDADSVYAELELRDLCVVNDLEYQEVIPQLAPVFLPEGRCYLRTDADSLIRSLVGPDDQENQSSWRNVKDCGVAEVVGEAVHEATTTSVSDVVGALAEGVVAAASSLLDSN